MVAGGFALYMLQHLEDEGERMRNKERDIIDRAATLLARVELQSHELEEAWELEASAHTAARRVNIQQEIEIHRLTKRVEMLERQVEEMGAFVDSEKSESMKWTRKHKERADEYVEMIFDDIMDKSTNAAFWIHANPEEDACFFIARDDLPRRRLFIDALVEAMDSDDELSKTSRPRRPSSSTESPTNEAAYLGTNSSTMKRNLSEGQRKRLAELFRENGLDPEDVFVSNHFTIVTRTGIERDSSEKEHLRRIHCRASNRIS